MFKNWIKLLLILSIPQICLASQTKLVLENQKVHADVGVHELNRILVENDRITQAFGVAGKFSIETEEQTGQIFVTPNHTGNMYLNVLTEKGQTIDLALTSLQISPQTIVLKPKDLKKPSYVQYNNANQNEVIELMVALSTGRSCKGFTTIYEQTTIRNKLDLKIQLIAKYLGTDLVGEIYTITNQTKVPTNVTEKDFLLEANIFAIALDSLELLPKTPVKLFIVKQAV
jgi:type-F conjugative transfer system secretin TraK